MIVARFHYIFLWLAADHPGNRQHPLAKSRSHSPVSWANCLLSRASSSSVGRNTGSLSCCPWAVRLSVDRLDVHLIIFTEQREQSRGLARTPPKAASHSQGLLGAGLHVQTAVLVPLCRRETAEDHRAPGPVRPQTRVTVLDTLLAPRHVPLSPV